MMPFHTPLKYFVYLAKSHTNKNDTLKFPNEPQLRNSSAEAGMEHTMNLAFLLNCIVNSPRSHETGDNFS